MGMTITGDKKVAFNLRKVARSADNIEPVWARFGLYLSRQVARQFSSRGAFFGTPWKPLTAKYRLAKRRSGGGSRLLVQSGQLRESFVGRPMRIEKYMGDSAEYGSDLDKAIWHQRGTHRNGKRVNPPRPMLVVRPQHRKFLKRLLKAHILGGGTGGIVE